MSNSTRAPQRRDSGPWVMHLEKVCRLLAEGQRFTIELHPYSDAYGFMDGRMMRNMGLHILDKAANLKVRRSALKGRTADGSNQRFEARHRGGQVSILPEKGAAIFLGANLANYNALWRCWQGGTPTDARRRAAPWHSQGVRA